MNKLMVFGLGFAGLFGLMMFAESQDSKPSSNKPKTYTGQPLALPPGWDEVRYRNFMVEAMGETPRLNAQYYPKPADSVVLATVYRYQRDVWNGRAAAFIALYGGGKDATAVMQAGPWFNTAIPSMSGWAIAQRNRYGLGPQGHASSIDILGIIATAGNYTLPNIPGVGSAANAVLQGAVALGKGESLENAAIAAARGALPPWGQMAFDLAIGLYSGNTSIDEAAIDAGLAYIETKYPGARAAYDEGRKVAQQAGL